MNAYFDASVLVALFAVDTFTSRARAVLKLPNLIAMVSAFAATEFASVLARRVRTGALTAGEAHLAFANFDGWTARAAQRLEIFPGDLVFAETYLRRLDLNLRAPDAIHIAIAQRVGATLVTFDDKMAAAAKMLGTPVAMT